MLPSGLRHQAGMQYMDIHEDKQQYTLSLLSARVNKAIALSRSPPSVETGREDVCRVRHGKGLHVGAARCTLSSEQGCGI